MRKYSLSFFIIILSIFVADAKDRKPAVAGIWYPSKKDKLVSLINQYISKAKINEFVAKNSYVWGMILPHAGYIYSGPIAAYGMKSIMGKHYDTIVIIGRSHHYYKHFISIYEQGYYITPLGKVHVDKVLASKITKELGKTARFFENAHKKEHAIEAELPFLQYTLNNNFSIVPILFLDDDVGKIRLLASILYKIMKNSSKKILIVASSDMSHYYPYDKAVRIDKQTINHLLSRNFDILLKNIIDKKDFLCGFPAVGVLTIIDEMLGKTSKPILLKYANSGDTAGNKDKVVGYMSVIYIQSENVNLNKEDDKMSDFTLTKDEKVYLLKLARRTIEDYLRHTKIYEPENVPEKFKQKGAVFVTLNTKDTGRLRGCIGHIIAIEPLYKSVISNAISASTMDPRFKPMTKDEIDKVEIEISVMTPLRKIDDYHEIVLGKHGVVVSQGMKRGVFLPQVATETGWDLETFLSYLCLHKAGLPADAYKHGATLEVFEAIVFSEKELGLLK